MKLKSILIAFIIFCIGSCKETPRTKTEEVKTVVTTEKGLPKSTFEDLEGNPIELSDYSGKRVLLNFWATWCRPCIEEMPALLEAEDALANDNYIFLLASDQSVDKIKAFKEKKNFDFKYLKFNGFMSHFEVYALPATLIYNEEGKQVHRIDGATEWNSPAIIDTLKNIK